MPQCAGGGWRTSDVPYGKGSLHSELIEATFRRRRRAAKINDGENWKLRTYRQMMDRHQQAEEERKDRVIARVRKTVENLEAYKQVLNSYRADKFKTLQWGFKPRQINTPNSFQRYKMETKVYTCGFSVDTLFPEVEKVIYDSQPHRVKEEKFKRLLAVAKKRSDFLIDRKITNAAMKHDRYDGKGEPGATDLLTLDSPEGSDLDAVKASAPPSPKPKPKRVKYKEPLPAIERSNTREMGTQTSIDRH